jgi:hypothetical protein
VSYNIFKRNFSGRTFFTFGTVGDGSKPAIFNKTKLVSDVKFMKNTEVKKNSIEWIAEKSQAARRRNKNEL